MNKTHMPFPVNDGLKGINDLALFLNKSKLVGGWHFIAGTRFDQTVVRIEFDTPADAYPAWRKYCEERSVTHW